MVSKMMGRGRKIFVSSLKSWLSLSSSSIRCLMIMLVSMQIGFIFDLGFFRARRFLHLQV